jgi:hypothetical protein
MRPIASLNIDVTKIDKAHLFQGKSGTYLDVALWEKPDQYGNDGFITQGVSKEARARGEKGNIIGNWKHNTPPPAQQAPRPAQPPVKSYTREPKPPTHNPATDSALEAEEDASGLPF